MWKKNKTENASLCLWTRYLTGINQSPCDDIMQKNLRTLTQEPPACTHSADAVQPASGLTNVPTDSHSLWRQLKNDVSNCAPNWKQSGGEYWSYCLDHDSLTQYSLCPHGETQELLCSHSADQYVFANTLEMCVCFNNMRAGVITCMYVWDVSTACSDVGTTQGHTIKTVMTDWPHGTIHLDP